MENTKNPIGTVDLRELDDIALAAGTGGPEPRWSILSCIVTTARASGIVSGVATFVTTSKDWVKVKISSY